MTLEKYVATVLKVVKLGNEILFQYYHEKVISVVGSRQSQKVI